MRDIDYTQFVDFSPFDRPIITNASTGKLWKRQDLFIGTICFGEAIEHFFLQAGKGGNILGRQVM